MTIRQIFTALFITKHRAAEIVFYRRKNLRTRELQVTQRFESASFPTLLEKVESDYDDDVYSSEMRWLSRGVVLNIFFLFAS
jgi:hypothetical protein